MEDLSRQADIPIDAIGASAGTVVLKAKVTGDAAYRFNVTHDGTLEWGSGAAAADVTILREATRTLSLRFGAGTFPTFRFYGSYTSPASYDRLTLQYNAGAYEFITESTAAAADLSFTANAEVIFSAGGANMSLVAGSLNPGVDNAVDLGVAATGRWRSIYVGTHIQIDGSSGGASVRVPNGTAMRTGSAGTSYFFDLGDVIFRDGDGSSSGADVTIYGKVSLSGDAILDRDGANILAQKNGATSQEFRVYGSTTGPVYTLVAHTGSSASIGTNSGGGSLFLTTGGSGRWLVGGTTGHLTANTDNAYDIGATGANRPRSIYWGTQAIGALGSASAPSWTFTGRTSTGVWSRAADLITVSCGGADNFEFQPSTLLIGSTTGIYWGNTNSASTIASYFTSLVSDGTGVLAQKNGTNAQAFRVYNTTTGPEYGTLAWASNILSIGTNAARVTRLRTNGTDRWEVGATTGHLLGLSDNTYDIGAAGATRPRSIYLGTSVEVGSSPADSGVIRLQNDTTIRWRNAANDANIDALAVLSTNDVVLGNGAYAIRIGNNASATIGFHGATPVARPTYGAPTGGGPTRTTFDTTTVTLAQLAERVRAIIDDFRSRGDFA